MSGVIQIIMGYGMTSELLPIYQALLEEHDLEALTVRASMYSGVFLPTPLPAYGQAPFRLMVVGQETRGWNGKLTKLVDARKADSLAAYVTQSVNTYQQRRLRKPGQSRFLQFLRQAERQLGLPTNAVHWSNLYACDYRKKTPRNRPDAEISALTSFSQPLLAQQIVQLRPDAILFTTGPSCDAYIKAFCAQHLGGYSNSQVIEPRKLWTFLAGGIPCYRTTHPRYVRDNAYRRQALALIRGQMESAGSSAPKKACPV